MRHVNQMQTKHSCNVYYLLSFTTTERWLEMCRLVLCVMLRNILIMQFRIKSEMFQKSSLKKIHDFLWHKSRTSFKHVCFLSKCNCLSALQSTAVSHKREVSEANYFKTNQANTCSSSTSIINSNKNSRTLVKKRLCNINIINTQFT